MMYDNHKLIKMIRMGSQMKTQMKVTARIIAEQLGLSLATVDRALNNRGNVKEATHQKIMEKAKELNYTPNKLASFLSRKKQYSIAVVYPEYPRYFWEQVEIGITRAMKELTDFGLNVETIHIKDQEDTRDGFVQEILQSNRFDALALVAGQDIFIDVIDGGIDQGIPICTFNHDSPASKRLFYVGSDYRSAGRVAAELLCKFIGMSGSISLLASTETSFQTQEKITGFREVLIEYPDVEMMGPLKFDRHDIRGSLDQLKDALLSSNGIYVVNAELSAVASYLEDVACQRKIALVGHDMNQSIYHYLNRGVITAAISQDPISQGYLAVKKLFGLLLGEERINNKDMFTKLEIVTKENAKFYV
jgi:LacI family transcriptional regulator